MSSSSGVEIAPLGLERALKKVRQSRKKRQGGKISPCQDGSVLLILHTNAFWVKRAAEENTPSVVNGVAGVAE